MHFYAHFFFLTGPMLETALFTPSLNLVRNMTNARDTAVFRALVIFKANFPYAVSCLQSPNTVKPV